MEVAQGVHRLGSRFINFYLIEDGGRLTLLDAGLPGYWEQIPRGVRRLGRSLEDIDAVVLTHGHQDHLGTAELARREASANLFVHGDDALLARGKVKVKPPRIAVWRPAVLRFLIHGLRNGGMRIPPVAEPQTFSDGEVLDVPGRPRVVHAPGHSPGSCALVLAERAILFSGDVLVTLDVLSGEKGPRIQPDAFNSDPAAARSAVEMLRGLRAKVILPGHGEPFAGGVEEAVGLARSRF